MIGWSAFLWLLAFACLAVDEPALAALWLLGVAIEAECYRRELRRGERDQ